MCDDDLNETLTLELHVIWWIELTMTLVVDLI